MNYRWSFMGIGVIIFGFYIYFIYKMPFSWLILVFGFIFFLIGFMIKRHDKYAEGKLPLKSRI